MLPQGSWGCRLVRPMVRLPQVWPASLQHLVKFQLCRLPVPPFAQGWLPCPVAHFIQFEIYNIRRPWQYKWQTLLFNLKSFPGSTTLKSPLQSTLTETKVWDHIMSILTHLVQPLQILMSIYGKLKDLNSIYEDVLTLCHDHMLLGCVRCGPTCV